MTYGKNRLGALGLSFLVALGLMAFSAAGAQAQNNWYENGVAITELKNIKIEQGSEPEGSLLIPFFNFELKCKKFKTLSAQVWPLSDGIGVKKGGALGHATIDFEECKFYTLPSLVHASKCTISILPMTVLLEVIGAGVTLAYPLKAGEPFGLIAFGALCPVFAEEEIGVTGSFLLHTKEFKLTSTIIEKVCKFLVLLPSDAEHKLALGLFTVAQIQMSGFVGLESGACLGIG